MTRPEDGYPPDAPTRLVGDGRIAVRVPVAWPMSTQWGPVTQSCVRSPSGYAIPAIGFVAVPVPGVLSVRLAAGFHVPPQPDDWPLVDVEGGQVHRVDHEGRDVFDVDADLPRVTTVRIMSTDRTGSILLEGDGDLARTVAATARVLPPGLTVVPHAFCGRAPGMYRRHTLDEVIAARMELAGLVAVVRHVRREPRGERCSPLWGTVVPLGSEVHVTVTRDDERDRGS